MMESDSFHSFQDLSHAVRGCRNSVLSESETEKENTLDSSQQLCASITARVHTSPETDREVVR